MELKSVGQYSTELHKIVTEVELIEAFSGCNFGSKDYREIIKEGLLKSTCGWWNGQTLYEILKYLELITEHKKPKLTVKGQAYLWHSLKQPTKTNN